MGKYNKYYCGVGSRNTPPNILILMTNLALALSKEGWILRSGGAPGADTAFENGAGSQKEIFLPWKKFNNNPSILYPATPLAINITKKYHKFYNYLSTGGKALHARNVHQILGFDVENDPISKFVVCWTSDGCEDGSQTSRLTGGTGQAIRIATAYSVPIFNLKNNNAFENLLEFVSKIQ